jgi:hypothetical protein
MLDRAKAGLAEPFRGVASGKGIVPGLFTIENTGISLAPLLEAARLFVAALSTEQRKIASFAIGDERWRKWSNIHPWLMRHGSAWPISAMISARPRSPCCAKA